MGKRVESMKRRGGITGEGAGEREAANEGEATGDTVIGG
jgi:hypothetical protein